MYSRESSVRLVEKVLYGMMEMSMKRLHIR